MGLLHKCPECGKICEHDVCTREVVSGYDSMMLQCSECKQTWFASRAITEVRKDVVECPKCGSHETDIDEGPWIYDTYMKINQTCYECGHQWTGIYKLPERIGVEDESDPPEDNDELPGMPK